MIRRARVLAAAAVLAPVAALAAATLPAASPAPGPSAEAAPALTAARGPLILGHRGAPGYRPEHTEGSYELAVRMGADFIEPDLVPTKDGQLVVRHENEIGGTTDVASHPEFANRKTTKTVDGTKITGWFTEDFTLAELKTLRAAERLPDIRQHNTLYNGRYQVLTLQEVIDLAKRFTREYHRKIGIVPETKHPTYFRSIGLPLENTLIATLKRNHFDQGGRTVVQSFEPSSLRILHRALPHVTVLQCISNTGSPYDTTATGSGPTFADMTKPAGLKTVREYADWIGPEKTLVIPPKADGSLGTPVHSSPTRTARGSRSSRTPSATRTSSCRPTCATAPSPVTTGTCSRSMRRTSRRASTACSATTPTPPTAPARTSSASAPDRR